METLRENLLALLIPGVMVMAAGGAVMVIHGLLMLDRLRSGQSISECVTTGAGRLLAGAGFFTWLLVTEDGTVPWDMIGPVALLVFTAPAILAWLGPPDQHVDACNLCQIGKGSAYSHYYGYLRLMEGSNAIRKRLEAFQRNNPAGLSEDELRHFYSDALVVLAPEDGEYPDGLFTELKGINNKKGELPSFQVPVGGNYRSYGAYDVYGVTSSGQRNSQPERYVAMEKVGALGTLRKLKQHRPAGLSESDCKKQMSDMIDELEKIAGKKFPGQLKVVKYQPGEHVGDAIMTAIAMSE